MQNILQDKYDPLYSINTCQEKDKGGIYTLKGTEETPRTKYNVQTVWILI